ncbi:hypothetical protein GOP47_0030226 [Adiantum capillus-veneris]|nr:hypothetical protein GOP47_0030226 [Adiantum capillus-veneris]
MITDSCQLLSKRGWKVGHNHSQIGKQAVKLRNWVTLLPGTSGGQGEKVGTVWKKFSMWKATFWEGNSYSMQSRTWQAGIATCHWWKFFNELVG